MSRRLGAYVMVLALAGLTLFLSTPASAFTINPGDILISNHGGSNVQRLQPDGTVTTLTTVSGTPIGLAFDPTGNLYINVNNGIVKLDKATDALTTFFTGNGQREGLTFDPATGHLFSVSFGSNLIEEVNLSGGLVRTITIPGSSALLGINARGGQLVVSDFGNGKVFLGSTAGGAFTTVGTVNPGNTFGGDIDAAGNIFVNDFAAGTVDKFAAGTFAESVFISGLNQPANGLSIGDDGSFTISEFGGNAISVFNSDGTLRHRFTGVANPDELVVFAPIRGGGTEVPEPPIAFLMGSALLGLATFHQRRKGRIS